MGREAECTATHNGRTSEGKAYLETVDVIFRGEFRVSLKFADLTSVVVDNGVLVLSTAEETLKLELGPRAKTWEHKILNPRTLIDKLGVKPGERVAVVDVDDPAFAAELAAVGPEICHIDDERGLDWIFYPADSRADLDGLSACKRRLADKGAIWAVSRKRKNAIVKDVDVIEAGRRAGLVDVKVVSFSMTHTALKFMAASE